MVAKFRGSTAKNLKRLYGRSGKTCVFASAADTNRWSEYNYSAEMLSGSEEGSHFRLMD